MSQNIKPTVYIAIGLPGSGKSYWWISALKSKKFPPISIKRVCAETIRNDLLGEPYDYSKEEVVGKIIKSNLTSFINEKTSIIYIDSLNLFFKDRKNLLKVIKQSNYNVTALYFDTSIEICSLRLAERNRKCPLEILQKLHETLDVPEYEEGWDDIIVVN